MEQNQSVSTSAASDFVALGLNQASTYFEKLTLFARLRDEVTGRYSDPLAVPVNGKPSDALLEQLHWQVFCWVASSATIQLSLRQQGQNAKRRGLD